MEEGWKAPWRIAAIPMESKPFTLDLEPFPPLENDAVAPRRAGMPRPAL